MDSDRKHNAGGNLNNGVQDLTMQMMKHMSITSSAPYMVEMDDAAPSLQSNPTRFKTELCRSFQETGVCKYEKKCQVSSTTMSLR